MVVLQDRERPITNLNYGSHHPGSEKAKSQTFSAKI